MQKCPNCGQMTTRTEDWACRWCGHPLLSDSYKKIEKSYKQLKEDVLYKQKSAVSEDIEVVSPPVEDTLQPTRIPEPETKPLIEYEPVYVPEVRPGVVLKPEPEPELELEVELEKEPELEPEPELELEAELEEEPELEPEPELELEAELEKEPELEPELELEPEPITQPMTAELEVTVEELLSAYEEDGVAADARFSNKTLRIKGIVGRIEVKDTQDVHYVTLTSTERTQLLSVRCVFDKKYDDQLNKLILGQMVTVLGIYDGSIIDMRMRDCVLVD